MHQPKNIKKFLLCLFFDQCKEVLYFLNSLSFSISTNCNKANYMLKYRAKCAHSLKKFFETIGDHLLMLCSFYFCIYQVKKTAKMPLCGLSTSNRL